MNVIPLFDALKSEDLHLASDSFELRTYGSDDAILRAGSVCKHLYFIFKGLVYSYANDENEKILWYEFERSSFTDTVSFYTQTPSRNFIKAADNETALICISFEHLQQIYQKNSRWAVWGTRFLQNELVRLTNYYESLRVKDASQRYFELVETYPEVLRRIPLKHIASYLGISQVSLSRIRAGVQKR